MQDACKTFTLTQTGTHQVWLIQSWLRVLLLPNHSRTNPSDLPHDQHASSPQEWKGTVRLIQDDTPGKPLRFALYSACMHPICMEQLPSTSPALSWKQPKGNMLSTASAGMR